ncbi:MAG: bacterial transcriptional activator domain-containing protein [Anaerolineae bacterium]|nr:bacterial transcriptional activator domain-containing protein [Anaerolineae bacterium]NUQ03859.1 hypothetical protein [Anaerolineae bacterium]
MHLAVIRSLVEQQLRSLPVSTRVIIVHPEFQLRYLVIADAVQAGAYYARLSGAELSQSAVQTQIDDSVQALRQETNRRRARNDLIIDECDRAQPEALAKVVSSLLGSRAIGRIFLVSRALLFHILAHDHLITQTRIVPTLEQAHLLDYSKSPPGVATIEVRAFGRGRVQVSGRSVNEWGGALPRSMFFYLLDRGMVARSDIFRTFWPKMSVGDATNVFHVTKRKVSEVLGVSLTQFGAGFYHLASDLRIAYDVNLFTEAYNLSQVSQGEEAIEHLERALDLYRGDFLQGLESPWIVERREELRALYQDALASLAHRHYERGDTHTAYAACLRAAAHDPTREDLAQMILTLAKDRRSFHDGEIVYSRLKDALRLRHDLDPEATTRLLYEQLRGIAART